jgi:hypothetical protein
MIVHVEGVVDSLSFDLYPRDLGRNFRSETYVVVWNVLIAYT